MYFRRNIFKQNIQERKKIHQNFERGGIKRFSFIKKHRLFENKKKDSPEDNLSDQNKSPFN